MVKVQRRRQNTKKGMPGEGGREGECQRREAELKKKKREENVGKGR